MCFYVDGLTDSTGVKKFLGRHHPTSPNSCDGNRGSGGGGGNRRVVVLRALLRHPHHEADLATLAPELVLLRRER